MFLGLVCVSMAQIPIPRRPDGFAMGGPADSPIVLEVFFDLLCPDCAATWPTMKSVVRAYGNNLHFIMHTFPLPYHTWGFMAAQGAHVVNQYNSSATFGWVDVMFQYQAQYWNGATTNIPSASVAKNLGLLADQSGAMPYDLFMKGLSDDDLNMETRISWKYGCSRTVSGTPTFLVNGVSVQADPSWSLSQWQQLLNPLLPNGFTNDLMTCPSGEDTCQYLPGKFECCLPGEGCIPNVGCRC